jgi:integrase
MKEESLFTVQKLLGHKNPEMTQRYAHLAEKSLVDAVKNLDRNKSPKMGTVEVRDEIQSV